MLIDILFYTALGIISYTENHHFKLKFTTLVHCFLLCADYIYMSCGNMLQHIREKDILLALLNTTAAQL